MTESRKTKIGNFILSGDQDTTPIATTIKELFPIVYSMTLNASIECDDMFYPTLDNTPKDTNISLFWNNKNELTIEIIDSKPTEESEMDIKDLIKDHELLKYRIRTRIQKEINRLCQLCECGFMSGNGTHFILSGIDTYMEHLGQYQILHDFDKNLLLECLKEDLELEGITKEEFHIIKKRIEVIYDNWYPFFKQVEELEQHLDNRLYLLNNCQDCTKYFKQIKIESEKTTFIEDLNNIMGRNYPTISHLKEHYQTTSKRDRGIIYNVILEDVDKELSAPYIKWFLEHKE